MDDLGLGDVGQKYEVSYENEWGEREVFGWANDRENVRDLMKMVRDHPQRSKPRILNRRNGKIIHNSLAIPERSNDCN